MRFLTVFAALAAAVAAYTPPISPNYNNPPSGNPVATPGLNQIVPQDKPFQITWDPTTQGTISIILLRGPSTNVIPIATIAYEIPNTGSYTWTPTGLTPDTTHYGLLLVVTSDKSYQYSTQFGIGPGSSSSSSSPTAKTATSKPVSGYATTATPPATTVKKVLTTTYCPGSSLPSGTVSAVYSPSSKSSSVPTTVSTSAPTSPAFTGAADRNMVSFGGLAAVAVAALVAF